jgi:hypothetical protein
VNAACDGADGAELTGSEEAGKSQSIDALHIRGFGHRQRLYLPAQTKQGAKSGLG